MTRGDDELLQAMWDEYTKTHPRDDRMIAMRAVLDVLHKAGYRRCAEGQGAAMQGTHWDDCWKSGPEHYECAAGEVERLRAGHEREAKALCESGNYWRDRAEKAEAERDALRERTDRAEAELAVLRNNQLGPVPEGPLKALGAWVADHTDDDTWPDAEQYLNAALAEMETMRTDAEIGHRWNRDSSLEAWFPYTAEELARLRKEAESLRNQVAALHDAMRSEWKDLLARAEKAEAEVERLRAENERLAGCLKKANEQAEHFEREWYLRGDALEIAEAELHEIASVLPGVAYMDPPDGGSPSIPEQFRRMRADLDRTAAERDALRAERDVWRGRTICADDERDRLRAEVARLRANIEQWEEVVKDAFYDGFWAPATYNDTVLNEVDAEWEEYKQSPIYKAALDAARGES